MWVNEKCMTLSYNTLQVQLRVWIRYSHDGLKLMAFERKQMDIREKACTMVTLTNNCVSAGNYGIYSVVGVYPFGEESSHTLADQSTECSPCVTENSHLSFELTKKPVKFVTPGWRLLTWGHTHWFQNKAAVISRVYTQSYVTQTVMRDGNGEHDCRKRKTKH